MAKGYWIVRLDVTDQAKYAAYRSFNGVAFRKFGGRFLVRGGPFEQKLGTARQHNVVIEFPSYEDALACYDSPEYAAAPRAATAPTGHHRRLRRAAALTGSSPQRSLL